MRTFSKKNSYDETIELNFIAYDIEEPKTTALEALQTGESFSASLYVTFKLKDETGVKKERVYMGELPMMTPPWNIRDKRS